MEQRSARALKDVRAPGQDVGRIMGALIIRIGFWGTLYIVCISIISNPENNVGGLYSRLKYKAALGATQALRRIRMTQHGMCRHLRMYTAHQSASPQKPDASERNEAPHCTSHPQIGHSRKICLLLRTNTRVASSLILLAFLGVRRSVPERSGNEILLAFLAVRRSAPKR